LALSKKVFASFGSHGRPAAIFAGCQQLTTTNAGDASINGFSSHSLADINLGAWLYSDKFYAGASLIQVAPQKLYNSSTGGIDKGKLAHHYVVMAGYKIPLGYDFTFIPSF
jgi:hypothetical protein